MRVIGLVLALGVVVAPLAAQSQQTGGIWDGAVLRWPQDFFPRPSGPLMVLAVDAASGRVVPGANTTHVFLGNEYWDPSLASRHEAEGTLQPGYYQLSVVAPGYEKTSVRVFINELTTRLPLIIKLERAISSDPQERHLPKQR